MFQWIRECLSNDTTHQNRGCADIEKVLLQKVEWDEEIEVAREIQTVELVWSGGHERTVERVVEPAEDYLMAWKTPDGELIFDSLHEEPAYWNVVDRREEIIETKTVTKTAWVTEVPPGVTKTGSKKTVFQEVPKR